MNVCVQCTACARVIVAMGLTQPCMCPFPVCAIQLFAIVFSRMMEVIFSNRSDAETQSFYYMGMSSGGV